MVTAGDLGVQPIVQCLEFLLFQAFTLAVREQRFVTTRRKTRIEDTDDLKSSVFLTFIVNGDGDRFTENALIAHLLGGKTCTVGKNHATLLPHIKMILGDHDFIGRLRKIAGDFMDAQLVRDFLVHLDETVIAPLTPERLAIPILQSGRVQNGTLQLHGGGCRNRAIVNRIELLSRPCFQCAEILVRKCIGLIVIYTGIVDIPVLVIADIFTP